MTDSNDNSPKGRPVTVSFDPTPPPAPSEAEAYPTIQPAHSAFDIPLPWQHTLLSFLWLAAIPAGLLWGACSSPGFFPSDVRNSIRPFPIAYLAAVVLVTPLLLIAGRRQIRRWRAEAGPGHSQSPRRSTYRTALALPLVMGVVLLVTVASGTFASDLFASIGGILGAGIGYGIYAARQQQKSRM